jgi:excisionase family DNA binding protein
MESNQATHGGTIPALYDRFEAAARLGVSVRTLDWQLANGGLAYVKIGKSVRIRPAALDDFIQANETRANAIQPAKKGNRK